MGKILVTGADGFIGSHLIESLVKKGYKAKAFVQYNSFNSWGWIDHVSDEIKNKIDIFSGDIRDPNGVKEALNDCEGVLHLAALIGIPYSYHSPDSYIDTNIKGTLNILQASRSLGIKKIVHTSTSEVYGTAVKVPINENHPLQGQSPYSASKIGADHLAMSFYLSFQTPISIIRPFNTYGPRQSSRAVIPTIITQILSGKDEIMLGSLTPTRDFNYVTDITSGFINAYERKESIGEIINLGSNFEISIGDTAAIISDILNKKIKFIEDEKRLRPKNSEVERLFSDNSKAKKLLSWEPEFSGNIGFRKGLEETIKWFMEPNNINKHKTNLYNI